MPPPLLQPSRCRYYWSSAAAALTTAAGAAAGVSVGARTVSLAGASGARSAVIPAATPLLDSVTDTRTTGAQQPPQRSYTPPVFPTQLPLRTAQQSSLREQLFSAPAVATARRSTGIACSFVVVFGFCFAVMLMYCILLFDFVFVDGSLRHCSCCLVVLTDTTVRLIIH